jgi:hypothetical protein
MTIKEINLAWVVVKMQTFQDQDGNYFQLVEVLS